MNHSMEQVRKQFVLYAALAIFILLTVLLTVINGLNFTMAADDADRITMTLSENRGAFNRMDNPPPDAVPSDGTAADSGAGRRGREEHRARIGPMGPDSPEIASSTRYFTYAFDRESGEARQIAFAISAVSEEDAQTWADSLRVRQQTGWTRTTYRYRVYHAGGMDYVTVIDQGRELLPSFRILIISISGELLGLLVSYLLLRRVSKRLFHPLEEADHKQKRFIADVEKDFKIPLTIMDADTEIIEKEYGETEQTRSIHRQLRRMTALVKDLSALAVFGEEGLTPSELPLSEIAHAAADTWKDKFAAHNIALTADIAPGVMVRGDGEAISALLDELLDNALKFSKTKAEVRVWRESGRVVILQTNDTDLPSKNVDQVFDRFTRLDNAKEIPGAGLGLSHVKEIVRSHNGRVNAKVLDGVFTLRVHL